MDINRIVQSLSSSGAVSGFAGGLAGSALVGALSGKKGRKITNSALKVGAVAAVGGLAYSAYQRYNQNNQRAAASSTHAAGAIASQPGQWEGLRQRNFDASIDDSGNSLLLIRAMIAAAAADGHLDRDEQDRVFREAQKLRLPSSEKAMLFDELQKPLTLRELVAQVSCPELALEVYAASLIAVDESRNDARQWLSSLAFALEIPNNLVASVHEEVAAAKASEAAA